MVTELAAFMLDREATAAQTWASVEALFVNNCRARRFQLQTELSETRQGDSSISILCARLKSISDALRDAGKTLDDDELVIQLLRGVNKDRHQTTAKIIEKSSTPVPFDVAVGMLLHDEIGNNFAGSTHHSALAVQQRGPSPAPSGVASGGQARPPAPGLGGGKPSSPSPNQGHNRRRRYTNNGGYQGAATSPPPWTRQVYAYPMALPPPPRSAPGILGARPPQAHAAFGSPPRQQPYSFYPGLSMQLHQPSPFMHQPAAFHQQPFLPAPPQQQQYHPPAASSSDAHGVDHAALMGALHNLSLQSPSGGWVADSGASTHLVTDPGLCNQGGTSSVQQ
ncbi:DAZ-associated protein 1 [Triticum aestivum]|uniref:DAZ-associated protein 1 n=1 Tax=Triticum aestivum TaxID=4565 RepID=UPI000DF5607F|nr:DAZ-associated protein 1-like [Triticum aestivum]